MYSSIFYIRERAAASWNTETPWLHTMVVCQHTCNSDFSRYRAEKLEERRQKTIFVGRIELSLISRNGIKIYIKTMYSLHIGIQRKTDELKLEGATLGSDF